MPCDDDWHAIDWQDSYIELPDECPSCGYDVLKDEHDIIIEYMRQKHEDYVWRDELICGNRSCQHKGDEHDRDEVGECQACGCAAMWIGDLREDEE